MTEQNGECPYEKNTVKCFGDSLDKCEKCTIYLRKCIERKDKMKKLIKKGIILFLILGSFYLGVFFLAKIFRKNNTKNPFTIIQKVQIYSALAIYIETEIKYKNKVYYLVSDRIPRRKWYKNQKKSAEDAEKKLLIQKKKAEKIIKIMEILIKKGIELEINEEFVE